ncbi:IS4 family transposase [Candidatus Poribacteria bacterium]|nr:IS4 family transposase [Candidatus Poribacteria bacterium]
MHVTRQAIEKRMTYEAAQTLKSTLEVAATQVISAQPQTLPLLKQFTGVYLQDSTWIALPDELRSVWKETGCRTEHKKAPIKLHLRFDVLTGAFVHFQLTDGIIADSTAEKEFEPLSAGSLRLADLSYFSLDAFGKLTQTGAFWITRLKVNCKLFDEQGEPFCLYKHLKATNLDTIDQNCFVGAKKRLSARLVALRCSEPEANKRRRNIRRDAKRRWTTPSKQRLKLAGWDIYITNIGTTRLTAEQVATITRIRWQVELMFKSFKSVGKVNTSRSTKPERPLCEVSAKLIAQLIRHWIMLATGWKCMRHDLIKTAKLIGRHARTLTMSFHKSKTAFYRTLRYIKQGGRYSDYGKHRAGKRTTYTKLTRIALFSLPMVRAGTEG